MPRRVSRAKPDPVSLRLAQVQREAFGYFQRAMRREGMPTQRLGWELKQFRAALLDRQPLVQLRILEKMRERMRAWYYAPASRFTGMAKGEPAEDPRGPPR